MEQQEEIKHLRQYLRDIFEQEEDKIVAASYETSDVADQGTTFNQEATFDQSPTLRVKVKSGPRSKVTTTEAKKKVPNLKAVSNIHQLYQDLFITDMKDEIASASNEVV